MKLLTLQPFEPLTRYGEALAWSNLCVARTANCLNIRKCQLTSRTNYDYQDYKQIAKFFKKALKK